MKHILTVALLGLLAALAGCGASERTAAPIVSDPTPTGSFNTQDRSMVGQLPRLSELDGLRSASTLFSAFTSIASSDAAIGGGGELTFNAPAGGFAWVVFDLGLRTPDFTIGSVEFTNADWSGITPAPQVFVGITDYTNGIWRFRQTDPATHITSFSSVPAGIDFTSPGGHSYLAIITGESGLSLGNDIDILAAAGPGGELPADFVISFPGMPDNFGQRNALVVRPDFSGGDIATYCQNNNGGALVRFDYDDATDSLSTTVKTLYDGAEPLGGANAYRLDYYSDGRLAIGAAKQAPNLIREIRELTPNSLDFSFGSFQTAVDNTVLPASFANPQFDYKVDADDEPHCLFMTNTGKLGYAYYVAGSWGTDTGGPAITGSISMLLSGTDAIVAYQQEAGPDRKVAVSRMTQRPAGVDFGSAADAYTLVGGRPGNGLSMAQGLGSSLHIATGLNPGAGGNHQLGFAYSDDGVIAGTWDQRVADDGAGGTEQRGYTPSIGLLRDGTPVIAYYDETNKSLRLAISGTPDGDNLTGENWDTYRLDTSSLGSEVGIDPALGVIERSGADPDKVIVAYGVLDNGSPSMRIILLDAPAPAT